MQRKTENRYLLELAKSYPNRTAVSSEIIHLTTILDLPKGTEHFLSDLHGEHEAYMHIRRNASGVIRKKVDLLFSKTVTAKERAELATLIYYPEEKLDELRERIGDLEDWYSVTILRLVELARLVGAKYTRSRVRKRLEKIGSGYDEIIDELLNLDTASEYKLGYHESIIRTVIATGCAEPFISALAAAIKSLIIDHLHIVGDIFDRGPRADIILDEMMKEDSIDIQWGNHDVLWMSAAAGSRTAIATVLNNSITYKNLDVIEMGYGISLRPLTLFASEVYRDSDISCFMPKGGGYYGFSAKEDDKLVARMHKAISIIQFKLEGQTILRNPLFHMEDRLLLDKIDFERGTVRIDGKDYELRDSDFPTVDPENPYALTDGERQVMQYLKSAFMRSEKLQRHVAFLYEKGEMYTIFNKNLLFHGAIPISDNGELLAFDCAEGRRGRALMDYCDRMARRAYFSKDGTEARLVAKDFLWFLWCGKDSPLSARKKIATFERLLVKDESTWDEPKNAYYNSWDNRDVAEMILAEFGLGGEGSHIINGHIPIKLSDSPVKAGGRLIVIDGGFCRAYQPKTGIAGYTLIYNADGMRISAHEPFSGVRDAIENNRDIVSDTVIFEHSASKLKIRDTDGGLAIMKKIEDLGELLLEFEAGNIKERTHANM